MPRRLEIQEFGRAASERRDVHFGAQIRDRPAKLPSIPLVSLLRDSRNGTGSAPPERRSTHRQWSEGSA
jgi:hypothetical protein